MYVYIHRYTHTSTTMMKHRSTQYVRINWINLSHCESPARILLLSFTCSSSSSFTGEGAANSHSLPHRSLMSITVKLTVFWECQNTSVACSLPFGWKLLQDWFFVFRSLEITALRHLRSYTFYYFTFTPRISSSCPSCKTAGFAEISGTSPW